MPLRLSPASSRRRAARFSQGMTVLSGRRVALMNDYLGFALKALVRRSGRTGQFKTSITDIGIEQSWVVR